MSFIVANTGETISAKFDGALRSTYAQNQDYIVDNVGDEFALTYNASSLQITCGTGVANISGRGFASEEDNSITLPANSQIWLCLRIDLSQIQGSEGMLYANTTSTIASDNLSNGSGKHDLLLAVVQTGASGITSLVDSRVIKGSSVNIKTIGNQSLVGSGNVDVKTIKNQSIFGSGNINTNSFSGIDTSNLLMTLTINTTNLYTWTATQDCYLVSYFVTNADNQMDYYYRINGVNIGKQASLSGIFYDVNVIKQGQVMTAKYNELHYSGGWVKAYGIKY